MLITMVWESFVAGAEKTTCLAPAFGCGCTFSREEGTSGLADIAMSKVRIMGLSHLVSLHHQGMAVNLNGNVVLAMDGVIPERMPSRQ